MCTYSQLKKNMFNTPTPPPPPSGSNVPKLSASGGIDITKCIGGRSMELTTLVTSRLCVDYVYSHECYTETYFNVFKNFQKY